MRVVIFGCGGHAKSIMNTLLKNDETTEILLVDKNARANESFMGFKAEHNYELGENDFYIVAVGDNDAREKMYDILKNGNSGHCVSVVSGSACIGIDVTIGQGTFVAPNAYIGPQAVIGYNAIINTGSVVEHETVIGNHTHIAPHATVCGRSRVGNNVFCGAGSTVADKVSVCNNVIIGAGAVVVENIMEEGTYVGVPARKVR